MRAANYILQQSGFPAICTALTEYRSYRFAWRTRLEIRPSLGYHFSLDL
jgi:hypothetical protein